MSRFSSPVRDKRVINLAAEVADTSDRKVPGLLLGLKEILASAPAGSKDGLRVRKECWEYNLLQVLVLVLKQDFGIVEGDWQTAAALAAIVGQVCIGLDVPKEDRRKFHNELLPEAVNNMFLVTRRVQARYNNLPDRPSLQRNRQKLLMCYKGVLESLTHLATGYPEITCTIMESAWLLQLLISDEVDTVIGIMELLPKIVRVNRVVLNEISKKIKFSVLDELVYKLTVNKDANIGAAATKCLLKICDYHSATIDILCVRYRGLRPLLSKWESAWFHRDLKELVHILQAGNAQRAENERFARAAIRIQAIWRGFIARRRLVKADKAFSKFQKTYRLRQKVMEERKEIAKEALELERRLKLNRQKIMREFKEKQLHTIEILPAAHVDKYIQNEQTHAAVTIQKLWRGHQSRKSMPEKKVMINQVRAAITIQRWFRHWKERMEKKKHKPMPSLKPPGLTDERRVQLLQKISQYREENPATCTKREDLENIHKKAGDMLHRYYMTVRSNREKQRNREALLARLETDSELVSLAPSLKEASEKDVEMYSSHSLPVATKARVNHTEILRLARQPWWKKLIDELQDQDYEDDEMILF